MTAEERMRERAAQICAKNRRHIELSPGVGVDRQSYGWAVCDDIESDIRALPLEGEQDQRAPIKYRAELIFDHETRIIHGTIDEPQGEPAEDQRKQTSDAKTTD